jgi:hypothetical protein
MENLPEGRYESGDGLGDRPKTEAAGEQAVRPDAVDQRAAGQLREGVGPEEGGQQQPHIGDRQPEFLADQGIGDRKRRAVEVIQGSGDHQHDQGGALPAPDTGWGYRFGHGTSSCEDLWRLRLATIIQRAGLGTMPVGRIVVTRRDGPGPLHFSQ